MKSKNIHIQLYFTTSKLLGYIIFFVGALYAFLFKSTEVFIFSASLGAGLLGLKNWNDTKIRQAEIQNSLPAGPITPTPNENEPTL